jgi:hypothetical protein
MLPLRRHEEAHLLGTRTSSRFPETGCRPSAPSPIEPGAQRGATRPDRAAISGPAQVAPRSSQRSTRTTRATDSRAMRRLRRGNASLAPRHDATRSRRREGKPRRFRRGGRFALVGGARRAESLRGALLSVLVARRGASPQASPLVHSIADRPPPRGGGAVCRLQRFCMVPVVPLPVVPEPGAPVGV